MADDKAPSGPSSPYSSSPFYPHVATNTRQKPYVYYNIGVYTTLYNRIRGDLQNNFDGDLSTFDTVINEKIREGLTGPKAKVEAFLKQYGYEGIVKLYNDDEIDTPEKLKALKDNDYDFPVSSISFIKDFDKTVALARDFARVKYGADKKRTMLSYDDAREIMLIKEEKSDKMFYEANRTLLTNVGGLDGKGKLAGGPLTQAMNNAQTKLRGMKKNLRLGRLKALGWTALALGAGALTGGLGFATLGLGGYALGGVFGALYTTSSAAATLGGLVATGAAGYTTYKGIGGFMARLGQNWKDRKKLAQFKHSRGKYAEAKEDEWDKMGLKRVSQAYDEQVALSEFYKNYNSGKVMSKLKKGKDGKVLPGQMENLEAIDYVPMQYRKAFKRYIARQEEWFGPKARNAKTLFTNAKHHRFVANQDLKPGEMGFYNLYKYMTHGVEGYETSDLTPDEVILNYGTEVTSGTGAKPRLHPDVIKEHKNYPDELSYITARLKEYVGYEESFKKKGALGEYQQGLELFVKAYNNSFNGSLFENAYTSKSIGDALAIMDSDTFKTMINVTQAGTTDAQLRGVVSFLTAERDNNVRPVKVLSEDVGVGVEHQIDMSESSLKKGCESLGDTSAEAQAAAAALAAMNTCSVKFESGKVVREANPSVVAAINAVTDAKTKKYFTHILESKLVGCKVSNDTYTSTLRGSEKSTAQTFTTRIYGLRSSADAAVIRRDIAASSLSVAVKTNLNAILDEQIDGLETDIRDKARIKAVKGIKHGSTKFTELVQAIDEIKSFKKEELHDLWIKIEKVDDPDLLKYLELRFKDKVTHELMEYATDTSKFGGENIEAQMKTLKDFLLQARALCPQSGVGDKFIDEWQLQECIAALSVQVKTTFNAYLDNLEKTFLTDTQAKKTELTNLINQPIPVGLKEFFDTKTPESEAILNRARRFTLSADVYNFMTVSSIGGYTGLIDADSADSKAALNIYFRKDRGSSDNLLGMLQRLNSDIDHTEINSRDPDIISAMPDLDSSTPTETITIGGESITFPKFATPMGPNFHCSRIIRDTSGSYDLSVPTGQMKGSFLYSTLETLKSPDFVNAPAEERLATLAILKKKITAMMRVQMIKLFEKKRGSATTYPDFVLAHRADLDANLITNWESVAMIVDKLIDNAKNNLTTADKEIYNGVSSDTVNAVRAICNLDEYQRKVTETRVFGA